MLHFEEALDIRELTQVLQKEEGEKATYIIYLYWS